MPRHTIRATLLTFATAALAAPILSAVEPVDMSLSDNINIPAVGKRSKEKVRSRMASLRREFSKGGMTVTSLRDGEVMMVTVAADKLFAPNSPELKSSASAILDKFADIVKDPDDYKILVAVHTDDTGDDIYADNITGDRANAIDTYMTALSGRDTINLIPYGLGRDEPLVDNNSIKSRRTNRRIEIYIVPGETLAKAR